LSRIASRFSLNDDLAQHLSLCDEATGLCAYQQPDEMSLHPVPFPVEKFGVTPIRWEVGPSLRDGL
jgi:hypothetical protein